MPLDRELFYRARKGDRASRDEIFRQNIGLVKACVARYRGLAEPEDLFQQGSLGLLKAIERFDPLYGVEFSTYAVPVILGEIRRYLRDNLPMRISRDLQELALKARRVEAELQSSTGGEPSLAEVARVLGVEVSRLVEAIESMRPPLVLESLTEESGTDTVADPKSQLRADSWDTDYIDMKIALEHLPGRLRTILILRYFLGKTQTEVAGELGLSQAQISRLEREALLRLRAMVSGGR